MGRNKGKHCMDRLKGDVIMQQIEMIRLIADEGKILVNGEQEAVCVDTFKENAEEWSEVDKAEENEIIEENNE